MDKRRADTVHQNVVRSQLDRYRLGKGQHRRLRTVVVRQGTSRRMPTNCGYIDDTPLSLLSHLWNYATGKAHRTVKIYLHAVLPFLICGVDGMPNPSLACVIDQDINAPRVPAGFVNYVLDVLHLRDVRLG